MDNEITEPQSNPITTKLIDPIKEKMWLIIGGLLSSSVIAYIVSRFFIRSYVNEIRYGGQLYNTLTDSANIAVLTFGIFITFVALFIQFYIVPSLLRFFYFENIELYEDIHNENKIKIKGFFIACFLSPLSVLLLYHFKLSIFWFFPIAFSSILLFLWIFFKKNSLEFKERFAILYSGSNFSIVVLISLFPFSTVLQSIDYKGLSGAVALIIFIVIWFIYSVIQGYLVIQREKVQYIIGIIISLLIVFEMSILSPNVFKIAIAESIGIKDKDEQIYQLSQSHYDELL